MCCCSRSPRTETWLSAEFDFQYVPPRAKSFSYATCRGRRRGEPSSRSAAQHARAGTVTFMVCTGRRDSDGATATATAATVTATARRRRRDGDGDGDAPVAARASSRRRRGESPRRPGCPCGRRPPCPSWPCSTTRPTPPRRRSRRRRTLGGPGPSCCAIVAMRGGCVSRAAAVVRSAVVVRSVVEPQTTSATF